MEVKARWERLKLHPYVARDNLEFTKEQANDDPLTHPLELYGDNLGGKCRDAMAVTIMYYVQDRTSEFQEWAEKSVVLIDDYFFGDWRQTMPHQSPIPAEKDYYKRGFGAWCDHLIAGLAFSLLNDDRATAARLARFAKQDEFHSDPADWFKEHSPYLLLLCEYLMHGQSERYRKRLAEIKASTHVSSRVFAACLDDIVNRRTDQVDESFAEVLKYYSRSQRRRQELIFYVATDPSVLYHLARIEGVPIQFDRKWDDHMVELPEHTAARQAARLK